MNFLKTVGVLAIGLLPTSGGAHEFWIDDRFLGGPIQARMTA